MTFRSYADSQVVILSDIQCTVRWYGRWAVGRMEGKLYFWTQLSESFADVSEERTELPFSTG